MGVMRAYGDEHAREFRDTTPWVRGRRLGDAMRKVPAGVRADIAAALADVSRSRRAPVDA